MVEVLLGSIFQMSSLEILIENCTRILPSIIPLPLVLISYSGGRNTKDQIV